MEQVEHFYPLEYSLEYTCCNKQAYNKQCALKYHGKFQEATAPHCRFLHPSSLSLYIIHRQAIVSHQLKQLRRALTTAISAAEQLAQR